LLLLLASSPGTCNLQAKDHMFLSHL
jgi:hypothetical protein